MKRKYWSPKTTNPEKAKNISVLFITETLAYTGK